MTNNLDAYIKESTGAQSCQQTELIQELWSGYGQILRYSLKGSPEQSIIVKYVDLSEPNAHPRGWNTHISHQRKIKSYQVEMNWYRQYAAQCAPSCRVPKVFGLEQKDDFYLMILEDLDASGFADRAQNFTLQHLYSCIKWLASFHAQFLHIKPYHLWQSGTYWHLETRPDELAALTDLDLKKAAPLIDQRLNKTKYQSLVHGDAKLANFCFSKDRKSVAAVDFQYVGGGCGMKDLAYLVGSCLYEEDCEKLEAQILEFYFTELKSALSNSNVDFDELKQEWLELYPFAWTDFHRFLKGWSPGHWKINSYSEKCERTVLELL